jgi:hypothetical protein
VNRTRKIEGAENGEIVESHVLAKAVVNLETDKAGAVAVGRISHRFTGAAEIAAAILDVFTLDLPVLSRHLLTSSYF